MDMTDKRLQRTGALPGGADAEERIRRRVERWALAAGVTGVTANGLLLALYSVALPGNHDYDWTGPANDVTGAVSLLATIPMSLGVRDLLGRPGRLPAFTTALVVGNTAMAAASGLLVTRVIGLEVQVAVSVPALAAMMLWTRSAGRWGRSSGRLPGRLARAAERIGTAGLVALPLAAVGAALPWGSPVQYVVGGAGLVLAVGSWMALPVWQLALSRAMSQRPVGWPSSADAQGHSGSVR